MKLKRIETAEDFTAAFKVYQSNPEYFEFFGNPDPTPEDINRDMHQYPPGTTFDQKLYQLIEDDQGVLDLIIDYPEKRAVYIGLFIVHKKYHGKGSVWIGSLEEMLKRKSYSKIYLGVLKKNQKAYMFWKKLGFQETKRLKTMINGNEFDVIQMCKLL